MKEITETCFYLDGECNIFLYSFLYITAEIMEFFIELLYTSTQFLNYTLFISVTQFIWSTGKPKCLSGLSNKNKRVFCYIKYFVH